MAMGSLNTQLHKCVIFVTYEMPQMKTKHLYTFCVYWKPNYHSSIETSLLFIHAPIEEEEHT